MQKDGAEGIDPWSLNISGRDTLPLQSEMSLTGSQVEPILLVLLFE